VKDDQKREGARGREGLRPSLEVLCCRRHICEGASRGLVSLKYNYLTPNILRIDVCLREFASFLWNAMLFFWS
jgi:hypothetical protein